jgi:hypothetical protein
MRNLLPQPLGLLLSLLLFRKVMRHAASKSWLSGAVKLDAATSPDPAHLSAREHCSKLCVVNAVTRPCSLQHYAERIAIIRVNSLDNSVKLQPFRRRKPELDFIRGYVARHGTTPKKKARR